MRKLAPLALLMLAGLAAVTLTPTAAALCADDGNGGCTAPVNDLRLVLKPCADDAARACLVPAEDVDAVFVHSGRNNVTIDNQLGADADLEAFVTGRLDDARTDGGSAERVRADKVAAFIVAPGTSSHELVVDGNASHVRLQALLADGREAELDAEVLHVMTMMGGAPEDQPVDPRAEELADDSAPVVDSKAPASKDAPYLGIVAVVGVLAAIVGLRRLD